MILIMFFQFLIGFTDVFVAGYLGTDVLAAVGYVGQLYWTLMILANGLNVGTVSMVSQAYGAKSCEGVGIIGANSLLVGMCVAGAITLLSQLFPDLIVKLAGMPPEIQTIAENFLRIFSLVLIPTYVMILTSGVLRSSGRVRIAMVNSFAASSVNVAADFVLAFGYGPIPAMGYMGIAWATALSTTLGMCLNLLFVMRGAYAISFGDIFRPLTPCLKNLLRLGIPTVLQQTSWNVGTLVVYYLVGNIRSGEITALAAMTAGVRVEAVIFLPIFALNMAAAVLTGNRIGAGDIVGAQRGARVAAWLCLFIILVPSALIFVFAPEAASWLAHDQPVLEEMVRYLRINMLGTPFLAVGITLAGAIQGAGDTYGSMKIIVTGMWLLRIPFILATIYVFGVGPSGVWWAMTCSMVLMCGLFIKRFSRGEWARASRDKTQNKLLWEACLPGEGAVEARRPRIEGTEREARHCGGLPLGRK
ncbi:MAG: MATE family efflux transporter [Desulfomonilaceae bacterium]